MLFRVGKTSGWVCRFENSGHFFEPAGDFDVLRAHFFALPAVDAVGGLAEGFGIIIVISNKKVNDFEFFHVKQAMGRWMVFILSMLVSTIILFIPIIRFIAILLLLIIMGIFIVLVKQARDGKYYPDVTKYNLGVFPSLWAWLFWLFGINFNDAELHQQSPQGGNNQTPSNNT